MVEVGPKQYSGDILLSDSHIYNKNRWKMSSRGAIILLSVLILILLGSLAVTLNSFTATVKEKNLQISKLQTWLKGNITYYNATISSLKSKIANLQDELRSAISQNEKLKSIIDALNKNYTKLLEKYERLLNATLKPSLKNPTWEELKEFLGSDATDKLEYKPGEFDCTGFAITLRDHAWDLGFRCAFVEVEFADGSGHNLNAFQTVDKGLIFIDCVEGDTIAYVQIGKPYGRIALKNVKKRYIDCSGDPSRFWGNLNYTTHPSPFSYSYFEEYQRRVKFLNETIKAYNKAVEECKKGEGKYSYSQLQKWRENIEALKDEICPIYQLSDIVRNIETYWN